MIFFRPRLSLCLYFTLGMIWALIHLLFVRPYHMPNTSVIPNANLIGVITSVPSQKEASVQFEFNVLSINQKSSRAKILLSCFDHCPDFLAGQKWQLKAKLKKPQNLGNPGRFDKVQALKARHIEWIGYTRRDGFIYLGEAFGIKTTLIKIRAYFSRHLNQQRLKPQTASVLQALTLGLGSKITPDIWGLFRRTGTTHLMVISGAHIGLIAGLTYAGVKQIWSRLGILPLRLPAQRIGSIAALIMAFLYSVLAGFGVPAERALIVCCFILSRNIFKRSFTIWQALRYALCAVLLFEPHSVLMPGFYLSFIAVGILIAANQVIHTRKLTKVLLMQLCCLIGLMPITLFLFSYGSLNGFFANLFAIPWVGFILIPAGLLAVFLGPHFSVSPLVLMLDQAVMILLRYLDEIDKFRHVNFEYSISHLSSVLLLISAFCVLLIMPIKRFLPVILVFFISGIYPKYDKIKWGDAHINILDVAQGLSIVIQTQRHHLIYDTGVKFYHGGDMGQIALIPYLKTLKTLKTKVLDMVIISHPDLDHRGGLETLEADYFVKALVVDDPKFYHRGERCHEYPAWRWDGVSFEFLPISLNSPKKNNHSCVLKISTDSESMLLTGDIEQKAERYLVRQYGDLLKSSVLLVPHHASKTSSSMIFLKTVAPKAAIASYGFDNRYHFPHLKAAQHYEAQNIPVYSTADCGLIRVFLSYQNKFKRPLCTKHLKN